MLRSRGHNGVPHHESGAYAEIPIRMVSRLLCNVTIDPETGCWYMGERYRSKSTGYTRLSWSDGDRHYCLGGHVLMYRIAKLSGGQLPLGMQVHHTCVSPACINPHHTEGKTGLAHRRHHEDAKKFEEARS